MLAVHRLAQPLAVLFVVLGCGIYVARDTHDFRPKIQTLSDIQVPEEKPPIMSDIELIERYRQHTSEAAKTKNDDAVRSSTPKSLPIDPAEAQRIAAVACGTDFGERVALRIIEDSAHKDDAEWVDFLDQIQTYLDPVCTTGKIKRGSPPCDCHSAIEAVRSLIRSKVLDGTFGNDTRRAYALAEAVADAKDKRGLTGLVVALAARDWKLSDKYLKEKIGDKNEANSVLEAVERIEGKHFDMPELIPALDEMKSPRALILRKALSHKYQWLLFEIKACIKLISLAGIDPGVTPAAVDLCQDKITTMQAELAELGSVDAVVNFGAVSSPIFAQPTK